MNPKRVNNVVRPLLCNAFYDILSLSGFVSFFLDGFRPEMIPETYRLGQAINNGDP